MKKLIIFCSPLKLCYPKFILNIYVKNFVGKKTTATTDETTNNKKEEIIIRLPLYIGDTTKRLVKQLSKTVQKTENNTTVPGVLKKNRKLDFYNIWITIIDVTDVCFGWPFSCVSVLFPAIK